MAICGPRDIFVAPCRSCAYELYIQYVANQFHSYQQLSAQEVMPCLGTPLPVRHAFQQETSLLLMRWGPLQ